MRAWLDITSPLVGTLSRLVAQGEHGECTFKCLLSGAKADMPNRAGGKGKMLKT